MAQVCHLPLHEPAFLWLHFQAPFPKTAQHLEQLGRMLFGSPAEYDDVVQIYQALGLHQASQGHLHETLKGCRRFAQSKRHHLNWYRP
ncbi:hypothetical protein T12_4774 [Trichinella patagoniensis]|uniref:Uncharacterized protein n=1 Tax=Trichinella patagoniensis TaxID=990121 RepID=A0A0V1AFA5_9BILA|nr:hypothetical protein T12_4774 [Trichinella patagoniensis]